MTQKYNFKDLQNQLNQQIPILIKSLGIEDLHENDSKYTGCCPIHCDADNISAFNLRKTGSWICFTHQCHKVFKNSMIGLIRGILSRDKLDWKEYGDKIISIHQTVQWCRDFLNKSVAQVKVKEIPNIRIGRQSSIGLHRSFVRSILKIPSDYYINRGYSQEILNKYDVGLCISRGKYFSNRVVIPLYDKSLEYAVGFTGRSIWECCNQCRLYHNPQHKCPLTSLTIANSTKWKHSKNFPRDTYLYNFYNNLQHIQHTKKVILVESPGNVLRLEDAGIKNSVAIFGTYISSGQIELLDQNNVREVDILMDNDRAGQDASIDIYEKLKNVYNTKIIRLPCHMNDVGDMKNSEILKLFNGWD